MVDGYKKGMVRSLITFISLIITCVVVVLLGNALNNYFDGFVFEQNGYIFYFRGLEKKQKDLC